MHLADYSAIERHFAFLSYFITYFAHIQLYQNLSQNLSQDSQVICCSSFFPGVKVGGWTAANLFPSTKNGHHPCHAHTRVLGKSCSSTSMSQWQRLSAYA